jgi:hypothetical protein
LVQLRTRYVAAALYIATGMFAGFSAPATAQTLASPDVKENIVDVPPAVLASTLTGAGGTAFIDRFLRGDGAPAAEVAQRAAALIGHLGAQRGRLMPGELLGAVDRVVHVAARSMSYASVMRLAVANNYRPENAVLAWDFGPAAGKTMPGFERILPDDKRIGGSDITAHLQATQNPLLTDGISGLRKIELDLADGNYRIILMTQHLGTPNLARLPFGREVKINGMTLIVNGEGPANWLDRALLARSAVRLASGAFDQAGGFLTGDLDGEAGTLYPAQQGGAIVLEGAAHNGKMVIELGNFGNENSYLTGLIVEPPDRLSDLILSRNALNNVIPLDVRIALETELLLVAAETVQGIAPAAGQAFESDTVVTAN